MSTQVETEIGIIASDWKLVELGIVCEKPQYGFTASSAQKGTAKFLRITDIDDLGVDWDAVPFCDCTENELKRYRLYSGDIVFARIGATTGKSYLIKNPPKAVFASYLIRVRPKSEIAPEFLNYFFHSGAYWRQVNANKNSNLKKGVNGSALNTLLIAQPPLSEQRRIAHVLATVQTAIEQQARLIALTRELKSALMRKLFTEGLRQEKQKETEIGLVPESWEIKMFDKFTTLQRGKDLTKSEFKNGKVPVAGSNGIIGYHDTAFVKAPGVTVGRSGSVGKVTYYEQDFWAHNTSLYIKDFHGNDPRFAASYLEFLNLGQFKSGASVPTLDRNTFREMAIGVPQIEEQKKIGRIVATIEKKNDLESTRKGKLEELFRTLLYQLMSGHVRVNDLDIDSPSPEGERVGVRG